MLDVVEGGGGRLAVDHFQPEGLEGTLADVDAPDALGLHCHDRDLRRSRESAAGLGFNVKLYNGFDGPPVGKFGMTCSRPVTGPAAGGPREVGTGAGSMVHPRHRIHGIIRSGGLSTNTTPERGKCWRCSTPLPVGFVTVGRSNLRLTPSYGGAAVLRRANLCGFYGFVGLVTAIWPPAALSQTPTAYTLEAPREIRTLLDQLRKPARQDAAIAALAAIGRAAPYLAFEQLAVFDEDHKDALRRAQEGLDAERARRNKKRAARWITEKRIDLCVEYSDCLPGRSRGHRIHRRVSLCSCTTSGEGERRSSKLALAESARVSCLPDHRFRVGDYPHLSGEHVEYPWKPYDRSRGGPCRQDRLALVFFCGRLRRGANSSSSSTR